MIPYYKTLKLRVFFIKLLLLGCTPLLFFELVRRADLIFDPSSQNAYLAGIIDKEALLKNNKATKRIVLMGGSNLTFGMDSDLLEKELATPVINAALHYRLGSHFMMQQLKTGVKNGDVVLLSMEYDMTSEGEISEQLFLADFYPEAYQWIHTDSPLHFAQAYTKHRISGFKLVMGEYLAGTRRRKKSIQDTSSVFFRQCFSPKGDLLGHLNNPSQVLERKQLKVPYDYSKQIDDMNDFYIFALKRGIAVFFVFPPYTQSSFEENYTGVKSIENQLRTRLKIPILGRPEDALMDDQLFYDNSYHPNAKGRKIRTQRLLQLVENVYL